jgi:DNA topoisomerase-6 subunit B
MVIFVHIASVWVPFTSESKEAIAEYDEIHKEITLALRECGRRLGLFLRRRERAASEFRRRNIFELYIEEVAEACNRLKGGKLPTEKLKAQLQKIASSRTGGIKTDETLGKTGAGPEGLPHSIIVTAQGIDGDVPPTLDVSRTVAPIADIPGEIHIEEQRPFSKPGRKQPTKVMTRKKVIGDATTVPSFSKKGSSLQQRAGEVRTGRKAHLTRKKK